jgi:GNAT superfamily N-acetyltransferase
MGEPLELSLHSLSAKPLSADDAPELQKLLSRCRAYFKAADGHPVGKHAALERIADVLGEEHARLFGFTQGEERELCGLLELRLNEPHQAEATVVLLLLAPSCRGRGLGREIVEGTAEALARAKFRSLHLGVQAHEREVHAFWVALGFSPGGRADGVTHYLRAL